MNFEKFSCGFGVIILLVACFFSLMGCKQRTNSESGSSDNVIVELIDYKTTAIDNLFSYVKNVMEENYYSENAYVSILDILQESITHINVADSIANIDIVLKESKEKIAAISTIEILGEFYTLQEAYDKGYLSVEDLQRLAAVPEKIDINHLPSKIIKSVKQLYFNKYIVDATDENGNLLYPYAKLEDLTNDVIDYYGECNGVYCFRFWDAEYPEGTPDDCPEIIGGVKFYITGPNYIIWKI